METREEREGGMVRRITPEDDQRVLRALRRNPAPSVATMERWTRDGYALATDGCRVEPDGTCPHGCESWLLVLALI